MAKLEERQDSVVITNITPLVDGGKYPVKRVIGEPVTIEVDAFKDGHDVMVTKLQWKKKGGESWEEIAMSGPDNDRWRATLTFEEVGDYRFRIEAWADDFLTWLHDFERRLTGDQKDFTTEIEEGRVILNKAAIRAAGGKATKDADSIESITTKLMKCPAEKVPAMFADHEILALMARWPDRSLSTHSGKKGKLKIEQKLASFSSWYEFFPRSAEGVHGKHSTLRECLPRIQYAKDMGFDIVYFPPIHPIGVAHRKGKNNTVTAEEGDVGSPWAIGAKSGGHRSVEPALGTIDDLVWLVKESRKIGIELALDFAINCSPDHPYVKDHPEWFYHRPDGSIKYAENPPKKYQDIYPLNFHCDEWKDLWQEMFEVVMFWIDRGIRIFRVDNPHTKPVAFWEWLIAEVEKKAPGIIFLAEAFTRPRMMEALGKIGYTQSYTYFTWRETKAELTEYVTELTKGEMRDYYRANFWPNTPDILPHHLQGAPPSAFKIRAALAATLSSSWGMYSGYEFCENAPLPGREEYIDSEKYQLTPRDWDKPGNIKTFIARLNRIRNSEEALHEYANIEFVPSDNDQIIAYYKWSGNRESVMLMVVNLDPHNKQEGLIHLPLEAMGIVPGSEFKVADLMFEQVYTWRESTNFVSLDPRSKPVHLLKVK